jgi:hypothetical protein
MHAKLNQAPQSIQDHFRSGSPCFEHHTNGFRGLEREYTPITAMCLPFDATVFVNILCFCLLDSTWKMLLPM